MKFLLKTGETQTEYLWRFIKDNISRNRRDRKNYFGKISNQVWYCPKSPSLPPSYHETKAVNDLSHIFSTKLFRKMIVWNRKHIMSS